MAYSNARWLPILLAMIAPLLFSLPPAHDRFAASLDDRAQILFPGFSAFANASLRWSSADTPSYSVIVQVATEADVQKSILYANQQRKPFLAISGGHGQTSLVGNVKNGVGIHLGQMNNITIVDEGQAAVIEGGVINGDLLSYLWTRGKQTMTTSCDCVGYISPILGGGHGWLQGRYGLAADQLLSARLVLANGTVITVSTGQNPDLFWAIRGAGHNFGIVTQAKLRIYDVEPTQQWVTGNFVFTQDKLEALFILANEVLDRTDRPADMNYWLTFASNPAVDREQPIITVWIYYQGSSIPSEYTDPLHMLSPITVASSVTDLTGLNIHLQATKDGPACAKGFSRKMIPVSLERYEIPFVRRAFDIFARIPSSFSSSVMLFEGYPTKRVEAIDANSTAYPDRSGKLLMSPLLTYAPNAGLDGTANDINTRIRDALLNGSVSTLKAYVNYARGDESVEELYGHELWRLEKLRKLKKEVDPLGRFNFYAPIV